MLLTVIVLAAGIYYYFAAGVAPAATADPPIPFERKLAHLALTPTLRRNNCASHLWLLMKVRTSPAPRSTNTAEAKACSAVEEWSRFALCRRPKALQFCLFHPGSPMWGAGASVRVLKMQSNSVHRNQFLPTSPV
jgi:hypothetical protein